MQLSHRLDLIEPSPTLAITARAAELKFAGQDIVGFGAGEPDFDTPEHIKSAAIKALHEGFTKYTAVSGIIDLKNAIVEKLKKDNGLIYQSNQIIVGTGGKQVLYNLFMATLNPGDEVVVSAPYWVSYKDMVRLAGGEVKVLVTRIEDEFKIQPAALEATLTAKTKLFVINSPSNPTGSTYTPAEMTAIARVLEKFPHLLVVTDDIYEKLIYEGEFSNPAMVSEKLRERTVVVNGLSKAYSMTGWRLGYAAGPKPIIDAMDMIQGQTTSNATSFSQKGGVAALTGDQACIEVMRTAFKKRRDLIVSMLQECHGFKIHKPEGAFYVFPDISELTNLAGFKKIQVENPGMDNGKVFCKVLLDQYLVAAVPGSAFGYENGFRLSYATSETLIEKGVKRIQEFVKTLN